MILYELRCMSGHCFEGWFTSTEAFESEQSDGQISCPVCGAVGAERLMGGQPLRHRLGHGVAGAPGRRRARSAESGRERGEERRGLWEQVVEYVERNFEDVGSRFALEAQDIHRGIAVARSIRGTATAEEEGELREQGIEFQRLPWPRAGSN